MRNQNQKNQLGFTVVELLVVFVILVLLSSAVVISWNKQKPNRSLTIAQNETTTNIRKVQGYAVSSRNLPSGVAPKFYLMKFVEGETFYTINAVSGTAYTYSTVETVTLPPNLAIAEINLMDNSGNLTPHNCAFVIFGSTYGKAYSYGSSTCDSSIVTTIQNFPDLAPYSNYNLVMGFSPPNQAVTSTKGIKVYGLTGKVEGVTIVNNPNGSGIGVSP